MPADGPPMARRWPACSNGSVTFCDRSNRARLLQTGWARGCCKPVSGPAAVSRIQAPLR